tara:strand:+ start:94 stop:795 length:702 start_codon:yes stop_codon:yes gene_type:complete
LKTYNGGMESLKDKILTYAGLVLVLVGAAVFIIGVFVSNNGSIAALGLFLFVPGAIVFYWLYQQSKPDSQSELNDTTSKETIPEQEISTASVEPTLPELSPLKKFLIQEHETNKAKGDAFEKFCGDLFVAMEYMVLRTGGSGDRGVDLIVTNIKGPGPDIRCVVQCKYQESAVPPKDVRDALGTLNSNNAQLAIVVTTAKFTRAALTTADENKGHVWLIDGTKLDELAMKHLR